MAIAPDRVFKPVRSFTTPADDCCPAFAEAERSGGSRWAGFLTRRNAANLRFRGYTSTDKAIGKPLATFAD